MGELILIEVDTRDLINTPGETAFGPSMRKNPSRFKARPFSFAQT
jgi:hypothetical protein